MDNYKKDWSVTSIKTVSENIMQNEKNIRERENTIQSTIFARMYERRLNRKVRNILIKVKILA